MRRLMTAVSVAAVLMLASSALASATVYANYGWLQYNGQSYAESYFAWSSPCCWVTDQGGYEQSIQLNDNYFASCTAYTNMPNGYDDCPTAGVDDPAGKKIFSVGSFSIKNNLIPNHYYLGQWWFSGGSASSSPMQVYGKEVACKFCPAWNIWCMGGYGPPSPFVVDTTIYWNSANTYYWSQ